MVPITEATTVRRRPGGVATPVPPAPLLPVPPLPAGSSPVDIDPPGARCHGTTAIQALEYEEGQPVRWPRGARGAGPSVGAGDRARAAAQTDHQRGAAPRRAALGERPGRG